MNNKELENVDRELRLSDALLQLRVLQNLLKAKGIFSQEEFEQEKKSVYKSFIKEILSKANVPGDLDKLSDDLSSF